jgi:hypothetical protein
MYLPPDSVEYVGHGVDTQGLHTSPNKVEAIQLAPLQNQQELRSFLGLLHYYEKFIPNLAFLLHPLNQLLRVSTKWKWTTGDCAFQQAKD